MLFYYSGPLQSETCMQFTLGDKGELPLLDENVIPVTSKERRVERERGKVASDLGWNMDMQIINQFAHIQTEGAAKTDTQILLVKLMA